MEQEVESLVPELNDYLIRRRVDEMEENEKRQYGGDKTLPISLFKSNNVCFIVFFK